MEVLLGGEAGMLLCNGASGYNYASYLVTALANAGFAQTDIDKLKIWYSAYPKEPGVDCGNLAMNRKVGARLSLRESHARHRPSRTTTRTSSSPAARRATWAASAPFWSSSATFRRTAALRCSSSRTPCWRLLSRCCTADRACSGAQDNNNDYPIRMVLSSFYFDLSLQVGRPLLPLLDNGAVADVRHPGRAQQLRQLQGQLLRLVCRQVGPGAIVPLRNAAQHGVHAGLLAHRHRIRSLSTHVSAPRLTYCRRPRLHARAPRPEHHQRDARLDEAALRQCVGHY